MPSILISKSMKGRTLAIESLVASSAIMVLRDKIIVKSEAIMAGIYDNNADT